MTALTNETSKGWRAADEVEIRHEMMGLTMRVAARTLFDTEVLSVTKTVEAAIDTLLPFVNRIAQPTGALRMLLPSPSNFRFRKALKALDDVIYGMIDEHRRSGVDHGDLVSRLIMAQDDEGGSFAISPPVSPHGGPEDVLAAGELSDQVVGRISAGRLPSSVIEIA